MNPCLRTGESEGETMKQLIRALAAILTLMMLLGCAVAEETVDGDPVLYTIGGTEVHKSEVDKTLQDMVYNSYTDSLADYDTAIEYMIQLQLINDKIAEMGLDQFTDEEEEAFRNEAQAQWEEEINDYVNYFLAEDTDEARAQARKDAEAYYAAYGYSIDVIIENLKWNDSYEKLQSACVNVSDEDVKAEFDEAMEYYKNLFENDIGSYEYYKEYLGYDIPYTPAGFRGILHILLEVDEELMNTYKTLQAALEEGEEGTAGADEGDENAAPTQADVDAAKEAILESCRDTIDEIYAQLHDGETFEDLIAKYGVDTGMEDEENLKNGYAVHPESFIWDAAFTKAAFSDKMQKPGDVSDPVVSQFGVHILYYLRDVPAGSPEMTDEIYDEMKAAATSEKFYDELMKWMDESVVYNQEAIDAAKAAAMAAEQAAMEDEEAAPEE